MLHEAIKASNFHDTVKKAMKKSEIYGQLGIDFRFDFEKKYSLLNGMIIRIEPEFVYTNAEVLIDEAGCMVIAATYGHYPVQLVIDKSNLCDCPKTLIDNFYEKYECKRNAILGEIWNNVGYTPEIPDDKNSFIDVIYGKKEFNRIWLEILVKKCY